MRTILVGVALLAAAAPARAQMIWGGEYERAARPGAYIPYDAEPFSHRYYNIGPNIYINGNGWRLWDLEYFDRVERAYKFGYALPPDPFVGPPHIVEERIVAPEGAAAAPAGEPVIEEAAPVRGRIGLGFIFGRFRGR
jgi:hypothetical protein